MIRLKQKNENLVLENGGSDLWPNYEYTADQLFQLDLNVVKRTLPVHAQTIIQIVKSVGISQGRNKRLAQTCRQICPCLVDNEKHRETVCTGRHQHRPLPEGVGAGGQPSLVRWQKGQKLRFVSQVKEW